MNPLRLRSKVQVICISVVCAALPACAAHNEVMGGGSPSPKDLPIPIECTPLNIGGVAYTITSDQQNPILEYPGHKDRIAVLEIPPGTVPPNSMWTFTLDAPKQPVAQVNIVATDEKGATVTDFRSHPLTLTLFLRNGCSLGKREHGKSIYIYRTTTITSLDLGTGLGHYDDPPFWKFWKKTSRVTADLDHLSGYILAQGIVKTRGDSASTDSTHSNAR